MGICCRRHPRTHSRSDAPAKVSGDAVWLADPIFDHAKIAIIDAMTRLGLPPVNPVFAEAGQPAHLAYYYLWHFSAAEVALITSISGWEADIGLTWFTAVASLILMMGLAVWLSKRGAAASWVVALAGAGSLWVTLSWIFHTKSLGAVLLPSIGMGGWLFQATWVPQHLMAASCLVTAMVLVTRYVVQPSLALVLTIGLLIAAGFASSAFVGGVTCAFAGLLVVPFLLAEVNAERRLRIIRGLAIAALLVACLIAPLVRDQWAAVHARGDGSPIIVAPYRVFEGLFPLWLRRVLDIPGYWLVILPIELPATFIAGTIALIAALRSALPRPEKFAVAAFACLAAAGLGISWLLVSTLGDNNDLGLRAVIPAEVVLIVITAAVSAGLPSVPRRAVIGAIALIGLALSVPDFAQTIHDNIISPKRPPDANLFAQAPEVWAAARRYTTPSARIANNPALFAGSNTLAGEYILGLARQPLIVFCRPGNGAGVCAAIERSVAPRSTRRFFGCLPGKGRWTMSTIWRRDTVATLSCCCRRIRLGTAIHLLPPPIIVWRKRAMVAGEFM